MQATTAAVVTLAALVGAAVALVVMRVRLREPPRALIRINVSGREVPAVLGDSVVGGGLIALALLAMVSAAGWPPANTGALGAASAVILVALYAAGRFDDLRGDEAARGFAGHLAAARTGVLTGGLVKIAAGVVAGLVAGAMTTDGVAAVLTGMAVALSANLFNLLDRAPGRAGKVWLLAAGPLLFASGGWAVAVGGTLGALVVVLPADLRARGMLGDAGANPLGGVVGLGLAAALGPAGLAVAVALLFVLNAISERWSFSRAIERTRVLRAFDQLGRK